MRTALLRAAAAALTMIATAPLAGPVAAQDKLTLALGQRGNWDTAIAQLGQDAGIFKKHNLALDILWTQGAGESQQALLAGSADLALLGTQSAFAAYKKGAPVRIIIPEITGAADFWYVKADSPIKTFKDAADKTVAFSTRGASTNIMVLGFLKQYGVNAKPTATGGPGATLTQVMSGQVDVGWSAPPFGLEQLAKNEIRVIAYGKDLASVRGQTIRVLGGLAAKQDARPDVYARFLKAYRETIDWMYAGDEALQRYAEFARIPFARAKQVRDEFFPKELMQSEKVAGIDALTADAIAFKYINEPLTEKELADLIRIPVPK